MKRNGVKVFNTAEVDFNVKQYDMRSIEGNYPESATDESSAINFLLGFELFVCETEYTLMARPLSSTLAVCFLHWVPFDDDLSIRRSLSEATKTNCKGKQPPGLARE